MIRIFMVLGVMASIDCHRRNNYEEAVTFTVFNSANSFGEVTTFDRDLNSHGCRSNGTFAFVTHGLRESAWTPWVGDTIRKLTHYRGGCVIFMDYSNYSMVFDYLNLLPHFYNLAELLQRKVEQVGNYEQTFMYGFSFGSRLCFEVGARLREKGHLIDQIDACDPAGPGFDGSRRAADPKLSARNVACINTSVSRGSSVYNCHQNYIMGICGLNQIGASRYPLGSHGLCPYFYNSAFENNFTVSNAYGCVTLRPIANLPVDFKMGYMEDRKSPQLLGDVFVPTGYSHPWTYINKKAGIKLYP